MSCMSVIGQMAKQELNLALDQVGFEAQGWSPGSKSCPGVASEGGTVVGSVLMEREGGESTHWSTWMGSRLFPLISMYLLTSEPL